MLGGCMEPRALGAALSTTDSCGWGRGGRRSRAPPRALGGSPAASPSASTTSPGSTLCALLVFSPQVLLRKQNGTPSWQLQGKMRSRRLGRPHAALQAPPPRGHPPALCLAWTCHPPGNPSAIRPEPGRGRVASTTTVRRRGAPRCPQLCFKKGMGSLLVWTRAWRNSSPKG